jgi:cell wall-associated NlpC family hydrolase
MASNADSVVQFGLSRIGAVYKSGALFVQDCYAVVGIKIPTTALAQAYRAGVQVVNPRKNLSPGDLVFPTLRISQLYIGGGFVLTATKAGVVRYPVRRVQRAVRVTTPGGGTGLSLAQPHTAPRSVIAGQRPTDKL